MPFCTECGSPIAYDGAPCAPCAARASASRPKWPWAALVVVALLVAGTVLWRYGICCGVEAGRETDCSHCGVVLLREVRCLRVPRWEASRYRVERSQQLCGKCGAEEVGVTALTTVYCPRCGGVVRSFESSGQVAREDEEAWKAAHATRQETCRNCTYDEMMVRARDLYYAGKYGEAKAAFEEAAKFWPEAGDAQRWLRNYDAMVQSAKPPESRPGQPHLRAAQGAASAAGEVCPFCNGTGLWKECPRCGGSGIAIVTKGFFTRVTTVENPCKECFGAGVLICPHCAGTGRAKE